MREVCKDGSRYIGYEYKEVKVLVRKQSQYVDGYSNFGWTIEQEKVLNNKKEQKILYLKRDRKTVNKMELTRLEKHFEASMEELYTMERTMHFQTTLFVSIIGILGTICITGATFAFLHNPPMIGLCILLAIPGFLGWVLPLFLYQSYMNRKQAELAPFLEEKELQIYDVCKRGFELWNN